MSYTFVSIIPMGAAMAADDILYAFHEAAGAPPSARWAVTVQAGEGDPAPRVLAYACAEHIARQICLALHQSPEIALGSTRRAAEVFAAARSDTAS